MAKKAVLHIRLDQDEKAKMQAAADAGGASLSEWVRKTLLKEASA